jgi:ribonuclease BN (tRNA processing enzyme)
VSLPEWIRTRLPVAEADGFEVVVLGTAGTHPGPGRACSGFLFRTPTTSVVVDLGYGSTANLYQLLAPEDLDAVVISHRHPDHCADLIGMYYALRFHEDGPRTVDVHAPQGTGPFLASLLSGDSQDAFHEVCRFHDAEPGATLEIGDLEIGFHASLHVVPTVSVRVSQDGAVATYSADSAGGAWLVEAARDADLFICEATWTGDADDYPEGVHLTAGGAGAVAREAGAERLVLTHLWPRMDRERAREEAAATYGGAVSLAEDGEVWDVAGGRVIGPAEEGAG